MNQNIKYLGQRSFYSKVIVLTRRRSQTRPIALPGPLNWSVNMQTQMKKILVFKFASESWTWNKFMRFTGRRSKQIRQVREPVDLRRESATELHHKLHTDSNHDVRVKYAVTRRVVTQYSRECAARDDNHRMTNAVLRPLPFVCACLSAGLIEIGIGVPHVCGENKVR